ncbi:type I-C CRISPR-associated protein Cas8c/Csd1 [Nitrosomonas ureae]|uniref:CRISPR-associated protein, Csd1 family n=1 Tax=Nitrosomonas ureae TaxID=44577 RepID=A0A1H5UAB8_9PROT|nr:type I-C CRISPR-associated protein Cas8c/Csd1 [Nitrosomonas ureae]SEF71980.1 CRISPR-associated protein, Csd1 family [Nitrosomonas ureae]
MILQSLNAYYDRLFTTKQGVLPPYGWSWEKISYCIALNADGSIHHIEDLRIPYAVKKKTIYTPRSLMIPMLEGRTSGVKANYLWDNSAYTLGLSEKPNDLDKKYEDFWAKVSTFDSTNSKALKALQKFPTFWNDNKQNYHEETKEALDANFVFRLLDDGNKYIHDCEEFKKQWAIVLSNYLNKLSDGQCLIEGETAKIAELHSSIKGVDNAQSSGALIVSFNKDSFESYGLKKGKNASVGTNAAFKYVTVLNYLLRKDNTNKQRLKIGDAVTIFWAESADSTDAEMAESFMSEAINPTDGQETASLASLLQQVSQGIPLQTLRPSLNPATKFYILGLSPNAARISIRFWYVSTLDEMTQRIAQHYHDLHLEPQWGNGLPEIWKLTYATAPIYNGKTKADEISPQLAGGLARAIFTGQNYPQSLLAQVLLRIRSDGVVNSIRVSLCKAVINRQIRLKQLTNTKELSMSLDVEEKNVAYRMGRLFAVLESIQKQALGKDINATIRDRYWGAASATPALVFPMLIRNAMNHLAKIRKDNTDKKHLASFFDWQIRDIENDMPTSWPRNLNLQDQGRFAIGYYHQRYTRKIKDKAGKEIENLVAVHDDEDQTLSQASED